MLLGSSLKRFLVVGLATLAVFSFAGCSEEISEEELRDKISSVGSGVIGGFVDVVNSTDVEAATKAVSNVVSVVVQGTVNGCKEAIDAIQESKLNENSVENVDEVLKEIKSAKKTIKRDFNAGDISEEEYNTKIEALEKLEEKLSK